MLIGGGVLLLVMWAYLADRLKHPVGAAIGFGTTHALLGMAQGMGLVNATVIGLVLMLPAMAYFHVVVRMGDRLLPWFAAMVFGGIAYFVLIYGLLAMMAAAAGAFADFVQP